MFKMNTSNAIAFPGNPLNQAQHNQLIHQHLQSQQHGQHQSTTIIIPAASPTTTASIARCANINYTTTSAGNNTNTNNSNNAGMCYLSHSLDYYFNYFSFCSDLDMSIL